MEFRSSRIIESEWIYGNASRHILWRYGIFILIGVMVLWLLRKALLGHKGVDVPTAHVPTGLGPLGPWIAAFEFVQNSAEILEEGYREYAPSGRCFKISTLARWVVVATSPEVLQELGNCDESVLSQQAAANERNSIGYILSPDIHAHPYHVEIISRKLTQHLGAVLAGIAAEIDHAFEESTALMQVGDEWAPIDIQPIVEACISAATNRLLVGQQLARDKTYLKSLEQLSAMISTAGLAIDLVPELKLVKQALAAWLVPKSRGPFKAFVDRLSPTLLNRIAAAGAGGAERYDTIQWILEASPPEASLQDLCMRILYLNFSAIHTSSVSVMQALYDLAVHNEYQEPLRDEIELVLAESGGWTKQALTKMKKLDSALKETQRLTPVTTATMMRKAERAYELADGTHLPKGQWVIAPAWALNRHGTPFIDAEKYDAFRFSRMRLEPGHEHKHQMATPESGYFSFGAPGRHACPGRFIAAAELKLLLARIIRSYEFRLTPTSPAHPPRNKFFSFSCLPNPDNSLEFRARRTTQKVDL